MPAQTVFEWSHYLALADEWLTNAATSQHPEAVYRSLISRAYYAVFPASFDLAQTLGLENTQSASAHYRVRKFFETADVSLPNSAKSCVRSMTGV